MFGLGGLYLCKSGLVLRGPERCVFAGSKMTIREENGRGLLP